MIVLPSYSSTEPYVCCPMDPQTINLTSGPQPAYVSTENLHKAVQMVNSLIGLNIKLIFVSFPEKDLTEKILQY